MRRHDEMKRALTIILAVILLFAAVSCSVPENNEVNTGTKTPAPANTDDGGSGEKNVTGELAGFVSETLDGQKFSYEFFGEHEITVINLWATWCQPCVGELESFEKLNNAYKDKGVAVVGILFDSEDDGMIIEGKNILADKGATYTQLRMSESARIMLEEAYQVAAMPTTFFIDSNGDVIKTEIGANSYDGWVKILEGLLK